MRLFYADPLRGPAQVAAQEGLADGDIALDRCEAHTFGFGNFLALHAAEIFHFEDGTLTFVPVALRIWQLQARLPSGDSSTNGPYGGGEGSGTGLSPVSKSAYSTVIITCVEDRKSTR